MKLEPGYLLGMALQTIPEPRKIARELFALDLPREVLWQVLILMMVGSTFLGVVTGLMFPPGPEFAGTLLASPMIAGLAETSAAIISVFLIYWVAKAAGGTGRFKDGIAVMAWLNFVILLIQVAVLALSLFAPGLGALLALAGAVAGLWILSHFIAEAHGFASAGRVLVGIFLTAVAVAVVVSVVFTILGFAVAFGTGDLPNV